MTDWNALTERTLAGLETCDPVYRPTNFWSPLIRPLLDDMRTIGLERFKSWPTARFLFYPTYGNWFTPGMIQTTFAYASQINPAVEYSWFTRELSGAMQARRDFDAVRLTWDQDRWPMDLDGLGESVIGSPPQMFRLMGSTGPGWTRPYLNYLLCLSALSRHVDVPPKGFLEIGGGFGVLGDILMSRDPDARYVDIDLPPLTTVTSFYLRSLFGSRVSIFDDAIADIGTIDVPESACLPTWRIGDVANRFDVFINSYSFQEMEPDVVERYVGHVAAKDISYVVSLNSIQGKRKAAVDTTGGVIDQVTSDRIATMFEAQGYEIIDRRREPLIQSSGELVILRRKGMGQRAATATAAGPSQKTFDHRAPIADPVPPSGGGRYLYSTSLEWSPHAPVLPRRHSRLVTLAWDWMPPILMRSLKRVRNRLK